MKGLAVTEAIAARLGRRSARELAALVERVRAESMVHGVNYQKEGRPIEPTNLLLAPLVLEPKDAAAARRVAESLQAILLRVPAWRRQLPALARTLPLGEVEERWFAECAPRGAKLGPVIGRWDMNIVRTRGARRIALYEGNGVAVGGLNYAMAAERIVGGVAREVLAELPRARPVRPVSELHQALADLLFTQGKRLGRSVRLVGWLEDKSWTGGITEAPYVFAALAERGIRALIVDPRELEVRGGEVCYQGEVVDLFYRNIELREIAALERDGVKLDGMRLAFQRDQVLSSIAGDLDHKSLLEALVLPELQRKLSPTERRLVRATIPWTRLVRARKVENPAGKLVDLPAFIARGQRRLVLKPNRACGGEGVTVGPAVSARVWDETLARALAGHEDWVVQELIGAVRVPAPTPVGRKVAMPRLFANFGVIPMPTGYGILGRASSAPVVNVACGGGIVAIMQA